MNKRFLIRSSTTGIDKILATRTYLTAKNTSDRTKQPVEYVLPNEAGHYLLENPIYNKGHAFSQHERKELKLTGLLSCLEENMDDQKIRCFKAYQRKSNDLEKHIYLRQLQDSNEVLFYSLVQDHIAEMLPILYTPTVGEACLEFSHIFRRSRGIYLSYPQRDQMTAIFEALTTHGWTGAPTDVDTSIKVNTIVATDGGRILGLGDLGANGMGISLGKCCLYTAIGGIPGWETLPIMLDVGTDNIELRNDPSYIGWKHARLQWDSPEYKEFIGMFVDHVKRFLPDALLQWEDFNINCAGPILETYREELCTFNDDIQGTAVVTVGTLLAASKQVGRKLSEQKVVLVGSGSAGCGIATMIKQAMVQDGISEEQASSQIFMFDKPGLLHDQIDNLRDFQEPLAQNKENLINWPAPKGDESWDLVEIMKYAKPDIVIGVSGIPGLITEEAVSAMTEGCSPRRPIIFPLSNPTWRVEAEPKDVMKWSNNKAITATGTAFEPTEVIEQISKFEKKITTYVHTQCNNSYVFPGIGLASKTVGATRITDGMLMAAARALAEVSPAKSADSLEPLLPPLEEVIECSKHIAVAVAMQAIKEGVATKFKGLNEKEMTEAVEATHWIPKYKPIKLYKDQEYQTFKN